MFCKKCGAEVPEGSAFCVKCGAPVMNVQKQAAEQPGQKEQGMQSQPQQNAWNQQQSQPQQNQWNQPQPNQWNQPQGQPQQNQWNQPQPNQWNQPQGQPQWGQPNMMPQQNGAANYFSTFFSTFFGILKKPVENGKKLVKDGGYPLACGFIILEAVITAFVYLIVSAKIVSAAGSAINSMFGDLGELFEYGVRPNYAGIFFGMFFLTLLFTVILAVILFLANRIIKNDISFMTALSLAALKSFACSITGVIAIVLSLINPVLGLFALAAGLLWGVVLIVTDHPVMDPSNTEKMPLTIFVSLLITYFIDAFISMAILASKFN